MNYVAFEQICKENGTTPTAISRKLGLTKGNTTSWKKGGNPSVEVLVQLADELNCTTDYLLGRSKCAQAGVQITTTDLTGDKVELLGYYDQLTEREQGIIIGEAKNMARINAESKNAETA